MKWHRKPLHRLCNRQKRIIAESVRDHLADIFPNSVFVAADRDLMVDRAEDSDNGAKEVLSSATERFQWSLRGHRFRVGWYWNPVVRSFELGKRAIVATWARSSVRRCAQQFLCDFGNSSWNLGKCKWEVWSHMETRLFVLPVAKAENVSPHRYAQWQGGQENFSRSLFENRCNSHHFFNKNVCY